MAELHVYVDSSVWNASFDDDAPDMCAATGAFFSTAEQRPDVRLHLSDVVLQELGNAPAARGRQLAALLKRVAPSRFELSGDAIELADASPERR